MTDPGEVAGAILRARRVNENGRAALARIHHQRPRPPSRTAAARLNGQPAMAQPTVAIVGAGIGGVYLAADLGLIGCALRLLDRDDAKLAEIRARGGIDVEGERAGFAAIERVTTDPPLPSMAPTSSGCVPAAPTKRERRATSRRIFAMARRSC